MKITSFFFVVALFTACARPENKESKESRAIDSAQFVVDQSIAAHGFNELSKNTLSFDFRDKHYTAKYADDGSYLFLRSFSKADSMVVDSLTNSGFSRSINGEKQKINDEWSGRYSSSINSVLYFSLLPFRLNDEAVLKKYLGKTKNHFLVEIRFKQDGGGEDFEDSYVYWFNTDNYLLDYLAYNYEVNEGGVRFREVYERAEIGPFSLNQYNNYKCENLDVELNSLLDSFKLNKLTKLSVIENTNISLE